MSLSQMQVFNKYIMPAIIETLGQQIQKLNAASGGAIMLSTGCWEGDFLQESFYAAIRLCARSRRARRTGLGCWRSCRRRHRIALPCGSIRSHTGARSACRSVRSADPQILIASTCR